MISRKQQFYPWLMLIACCGLSAASIGISNNCMGVFISPIAASLGTGIGNVSLFITIMNLCCGFCGPVAARLVRKWPLRPTVGISCLLCIGAYLLLSRAESLWQFYVLAFAIGILKTFYSSIIMTFVIANWFNKGLGTANGICMGLSGLVGAVGSPIVSSIIEKSGWQAGFVWVAAVSAVCVLPFVFILRKTPEEIGLTARGKEAAATMSTTRKNTVFSDRGQLKTAASRHICTILISACGFMICIVCSLGNHMATYAATQGLTAAFGALMTSSVMIGNMSSKFIFGFLCDKLGPKRSGILLLSIGTAGLALLSVAPSSITFLMLLSAFFVGLCYACCGVVLSVVARELFGMESYTEVFSYVTMTGYVGSAAGLSLIGYSYDILNTYRPAFIFCLLMVLLTLAILLLMYRNAGKENK